MFIPALISIPFFTWFSSKFGKRKLLYLLMALPGTGYLSSFFLFIPGMPWLQVIPPIMVGLGFVGLWLVVPSMQADVVDDDEVITHARREGSFSSVFSWGTKLAWTINSAIGGFILVLAGFHVDIGQIQPPEVLRKLHLFYVFLPVACLIIGVIAISRYDLTRDKVNEIRKILEKRRGAVSL
jgi:GPH family glycoside/pentoside/hexuronide:cation symporter